MAGGAIPALDLPVKLSAVRIAVAHLTPMWGGDKAAYTCDYIGLMTLGARNRCMGTGEGKIFCMLYNTKTGVERIDFGYGNPGNLNVGL